MNIYFKIKHYLAPYFLLRPSYKFNPLSKVFNSDYWILGYKQNILNNKWQIENGIPLGLYTKELNLELIKRVHICGLCEYCFANKELGLEEKNTVVLNFLYNNIVHKKNAKLDFTYSFWRTFTDPINDIYYVHGMGQGQMLSLFSRHWNLVKDPKYLELLITVSNSYLTNFDHENGFVNLNGGTFFEEYPKRQDTDPKVFNGWMYSLIGLYDYLKISNPQIDQHYSQKSILFEESISTLKDNLSNYNLKFWSCYTQPKSILNIASIHYQIQHISLLTVLFHLTGEEAFKDYSMKLLRQFRNPIYRVVSLFVKLFISNIFKYKRLYKLN